MPLRVANGSMPTTRTASRTAASAPCSTCPAGWRRSASSSPATSTPAAGHLAAAMLADAQTVPDGAGRKNAATRDGAAGLAILADLHAA